MPTDLEIQVLRARLAEYEKEYGTGRVTTGAMLSSKEQIEAAIEQAADDIVAASGGGGGPSGCQCTTELAAIETAVGTADTNIVAANAATEAAVALVETAVGTADTNIVAANAAVAAAVGAADTNIVAANAATEAAVALVETAVDDANLAIVAANAAVQGAVATADTNIVAANAAVQGAVATADTNIVAANAAVELAVQNAGANTKISAADSPSIDAFGRWRVSNPVTLFDGRSGYSEDLLWSNQLISGTMTSSQSNPTAQTLFTSTLNTAGRRVRQSLKRFIYTPGKSQLILITFNFNSLDSGNKKKVGYFDDENGFFLQSDGTEISINKRTSTGGSAVDTKVTQANWNLDTLDGNGPSGITADFTKTQIFLVDFEWLGVGRVRVGFVIDGKIYYVHEFNHANNETVVYMSTGNLPIRYEMEHSGTGAASSLSCICATVISEGGTPELIGSPGGRWSGVHGTMSAGNGYALLGLRLKAAQSNSPVVVIDSTSFMSITSGASFAWYLLRNPTVTGTFTYNGITNTSIEVATGGGLPTVTLSGADIITMGIAFGQAVVDIDLKDYNVQLETEADGTVIPLVLAVYAVNNMSAGAASRWRQLG